MGGATRHVCPAADHSAQDACRGGPPRLAVVPDAAASGAFTIEIEGQPLLTRATADFCRRVAHRYRNPAYVDTPDLASQLAEEMRRWSLR